MKVVLLGHGIGYSASPAMHRAGFSAAGLAGWTYELLDVPPDALGAAVEGLRSDSSAGANVTIPYKIAVLNLLDRVEPAAAGIGAVNTIRRQGARLIGSNTDVAGIVSALGVVGVEPGGAEVVVLGAGGTARAVAAAMPGARLTFVARTPESAAGLGGTVLPWASESWQPRLRHADLVVNATPLGRREEMPFRPGFLPPRGAVIDLVYVSGGTPLVRKARSLGLRCADGWDVLLAQGAASFQAWTGRSAPLAAMREALGE